MANREALRQLQERLASRMAAVRHEAPARAWLAVEVAGQGLLFPLHEAGEIFALAGTQPVPHTQPWFFGVVNLRGGLHGVVDLGVFLGLRPRSAVAEGARLVLLNPALGVNCALLVDRLAGLRDAGQLQAEAAEVQAESQRPVFAGQRWRDTGGRVWQEIELAALAGHEQFLAVSG